MIYVVVFGSYLRIICKLDQYTSNEPISCIVCLATSVSSCVHQDVRFYHTPSCKLGTLTRFTMILLLQYPHVAQLYRLCTIEVYTA